jgi:hypothetical protein
MVRMRQWLSWRATVGLALAVALNACAGSPAGSTAPLTGDDPTVGAVVPDAPMVGPDGFDTVTRVHIRQATDEAACCFMEGAYSFMTIDGGSGAWFQVLNGETIDLPLPGGRYDLTFFQRSCNGNCNLLSPPTEPCTLEIAVGPNVRIIKVYVEWQVAGCVAVIAD